MKLYKHLAAENPEGIALDDAIQLIVGIFCTLDVLPINFRDEVLGRSELSAIFAQLARDGLIQDSKLASNAHTSEFWNSVIDGFMSGLVELNADYREKAALLIGSSKRQSQP